MGKRPCWWWQRVLVRLWKRSQILWDAQDRAEGEQNPRGRTTLACGVVNPSGNFLAPRAPSKQADVESAHLLSLCLCSSGPILCQGHGKAGWDAHLQKMGLCSGGGLPGCSRTEHKAPRGLSTQGEGCGVHQGQGRATGLSRAGLEEEARQRRPTGYVALATGGARISESERAQPGIQFLLVTKSRSVQ